MGRDGRIWAVEVTSPRPLAFTWRGARGWRPCAGVAVLLLVASTACSSDTTATFPEISGDVGRTPTVEFTGDPDIDRVETLVVTSGSDGTVASNDLVASHQVIYEWGSDGYVRETYSSYEDDPLFISVTALAEVAPEAAGAFEGEEVGTRMAMVFPPSHSALSPDPEGEVEADEGDTSTLFVYDIVDRYQAGATVGQEENLAIFDGDGELPDVRVSKGRQPQVSVPDIEPPDELITTSLIEGDGETVTAGSTVITQFHAQTWDDDEEFDSTWEHGAVPKNFALEPTSVIEGWLDGLEGVRAGSRVMLIVPPESGYGSSGNEAVDVGPDETLVYVIDIVDVVPSS